MSSEVGSPDNLAIEEPEIQNGGKIEPLSKSSNAEGSLEPRTPVRNRPVSVGMSPKSPAPSAGVTQIARDIESQVDRMQEVLASYESDLNSRLDQIVNRLKD